MAVRKLAEPLVKITLNVFAKDLERMKEMYVDVGHTAAIRNLIRAHILRRDKSIAEAGASLSNEIDLED